MSATLTCPGLFYNPKLRELVGIEFVGITGAP
jgi:hypothetical protein